MEAHWGEEAHNQRIEMVPWASAGTRLSGERWITATFLPIDGGLTSLRAWPR